MDYREPLKKLKNLIEKRVENEELRNVIFVENIQYGVFDGRSCGIDNQVIISGIYCENGSVKLFAFSDIDVSEDGKGFIENIHKRFGKENCFYGPNAKVEISDKEMECDVKISADSLYRLAELWPYADTLDNSFKPCGNAEFLYEKLQRIIKGTGAREIYDVSKSLEQLEMAKTEEKKQGYNIRTTCKAIWKKLKRLESHYEIELGEYDIDSLERKPVWEIINKLEAFGIDSFSEYVEEK